MNTLDYIALALYLTAMLGIGLHFRKGNRNHSEFFLAGRSMGWFPIGLSIMVTMFSAINYVAFPNEVFGNGLYVVVALPVFFLAAWPVARIWMPFFHKMQLTSAYEYLERRFDPNVRSLASGLFILWRLFWMATALYASGKVLGLLTGFPPPMVILLGGLIATVYTSIGGIRAVMWTDVAQFCVLFGGIALGLFLSTKDIDLGIALETARAGGRLKPFAPFDPNFISLNPTIRITLWSGLVGVSVSFLTRYGADQVVAQRYFTARSLKAAQRGLWFNAFAAVFSLLLLALLGLAIYTRATEAGALSDWDALSAMQRKGVAMKQLVAVIKSFPVGITGLIAAGLLAATMSSIDSGINACSAAYVTDFHKRFTSPEHESSVWLDRGLTAALGVVSTAMALAMIPLIGKTNTLFMIVNKVVNSIGSPLLALFVLAMFSRKINARGAFVGGLFGIISSLATAFFVTKLSLQYYAVVSLAATVMSCYLLSLMGKPPSDKQLSWTWYERENGEG